MTPAQLAAFRARIEQGRQPKSRWNENPFPRGWNEALNYVEKVLKEVLGENSA